MDIIRTENTEEFVSMAAESISRVITEAISHHGSATIGLCGGSTPRPVYTMLSADKNIRSENVTLFLTDERYVLADHADSNQRMITETLLTHEVARAHAIFPDTSLPLPACVLDYEHRMQNVEPDLVILGMGDDAHIASLFPPLGPEAYGPSKVIHTTTDAFAVHDRISVTLPILLKTPKRIFLITGEKKLALLHTMQKANEDVSLYPAQYLFDAGTTWIVGP